MASKPPQQGLEGTCHIEYELKNQRVKITCAQPTLSFTTYDRVLETA